MSEKLKDILDFRVNVATVGTLVLTFLSLGMYIQQQEARLVAAEKSIVSLELERREQSIQLQKLTVQIEGMRVQIESLSRNLERR